MRSRCCSYSNYAIRIPQLNWLQHANAHQNFSSQAKILSSNFLFSVPRNQKTGLVIAVRQGQNIPSSQRGQVDKAWLALPSLQTSSRNYVQPGKHVKVTSQFHNDRTTTSLQGNNENDKLNHSNVTTPTVIYNTSRVVDSSVNNHTTYTSQPKESTQFVADNINIDDDDILEGSSTLQTVQEAIPNV
ncbi:hypothetical protein RYX36_004598 [Vicia faba]